jgi:hypothetical protein
MSLCVHVGVDFNTANTSTLNPDPIIFALAPIKLFLVETPSLLDATNFGDRDWLSIFVELYFPPGLGSLSENVDYDRDAAVINGRLLVEEHSSLNGAVSRRDLASDLATGKRSYLFTRAENEPANLTYVLLSLIYEHNGGEVAEGLRFVRITVRDIFGDDSPTVTVTLYYVGSNINRPRVDISINQVDLVEGQRQVTVTSGSLVVSDADNDFYPILSATVEIVNTEGHGYFKEDLNITSSSIFTIEYDREKKVLNISGPGSEEEYTYVLNQVAYINREEDVGSLPLSYRIILFSVYDVAQGQGSNPGTNEVNVRLINVNDAPVISLDGQSSGIATYNEASGPAQVANGLNVSDSDNKTLAGATLTIHRAAKGDELSVNNISGVTVSVSTSPGLFILMLDGNSKVENYALMVTSVLFQTNLRRPNNMSSEERYVTVVVTDGLLESNIVQVNVTVVPINDPPIVQFNPNADPELFAPEEDRTSDLGFAEGSNPVQVLPDNVTVSDVDSLKAGKATITANDTSDGLLEGISVDQSKAASFGITVNITRSETSITITLLGVASLEEYKQVLLSIYYYNNQTVEPIPGPRTITFIVVDNKGAHSRPAVVTVVVTRTNDPVQLDLGVGVGQQDSITFTEIAEGQNGVGIHIVSRPHRVKIFNEEETTQNEHLHMITIHLRAGTCGKLDNDELVYLLQYPDNTFKVSRTSDARGFTVETIGTSMDPARVREVFEDVVSSALYVNLAIEPSGYCDPTKTAVLERYIDVTLSDSGSPHHNTTVSVRVFTEWVNDNAPDISLMVTDDCAVSTDLMLPEVYENRQSVGAHSKKRSVQQGTKKKEPPTVVSIEAFGNGLTTLDSGSRITIKFSHDTNRPAVLRAKDLHHVLQLSPSTLMSNFHMAFWTDPRTLVIYYPAVIDLKPSVAADDLTVIFRTLGLCNETDVCEYGVCHADGWSCSVSGSYPVSQGREMKSDIISKSTPSVAANDVGQTRLDDWWRILMFSSLFVAAVSVAVLTGWQLKRKSWSACHAGPES